jgi:hypothetical protein
MAGLGLAEVAGLLAAGLEKRSWNAGVARLAVQVGVIACWLLLATVNVVGRDYDRWWNRDHDLTEASLYVAALPDVCGIAVYGPGIFDSGGYSYLHRRLPANAPRAADLGYQPLTCFGKACVSRRAGACESAPMPPPGNRPPGLAMPAPYPQGNGVLNSNLQ